jgi:hypothetical protein
MKFASRKRRSPSRRVPVAGLLKLGTLLLVVAGVLVGLIVLGRWGRERLRTRDRYLVPLAEIECVPPPGLERADFLAEVRYYAGLPERLQLLDEELPAQVRAGFAQHPWVAEVAGVEITSPRHIRVRLTYRQPVLAVRWGETLRAVDGQGVLLPAKAPTRGLPLYEGQARPPHGREGTSWGDADLEAEARRLSRAHASTESD